MTMRVIKDKTFDAERALYAENGLTLLNCRFAGPADGESALKECSDITAENCFFDLRYPFWHDRGVRVNGCEMTQNCRAAIWYTSHVEVTDTLMQGIKAVRECRGVRMDNCRILSPEFGWFSENVEMKDSTTEGEYLFLRGNFLRAERVRFEGKYSFQYVTNAIFENCSFVTKDAFWHSKNVTVKDSVVEGEYVGWYSCGLTLINCKISGTQPFCHCKELKLINCEMYDADLAFEKSEVDATLLTPVTSVKNPLAGRIELPDVGEVIRDDPASHGEVIVVGRG